MSPKTQQRPDVTQSWAEAQQRLWEVFEAQSNAVFALLDGLSASPGVAEPVRAQLHQLQELTRGWTETQRQLWEAMFAAIGQSSTAATEHPPTATTPVEVWQQLTRPVFEAQAAWLRQWSGLLAGAHTGQQHQQ